MVGLLMVVTCTPDVPEKKKSEDTEVTDNFVQILCYIQ